MMVVDTASGCSGIPGTCDRERMVRGGGVQEHKGRWYGEREKQCSGVIAWEREQELQKSQHAQTALAPFLFTPK